MAESQDLKVDPDTSRREKISLDGAMSRGPKNAPVTIVEYSDFECPYCGKAQPDLEKSLEPYKDKVRLVFKTFPLERIHPWAKNAAIGARCAARQKPETFWTFADGYFAAQKDISPQTIKSKSMELAGKAGLDAKAFESCYDKAETASEIQADIDEGEKVGVNSTPSFYVNGHPIRGYSNFEPFKELIDSMLAGKHP
jgi:protein-disulfide isomerase